LKFETADAVTGDPDVVVLCSSDPEYAALAPRVIQELRDAGKATPVIVAGDPVDSIEQLKTGRRRGFRTCSQQCGGSPARLAGAVGG
jgi:methylmalonyl-CoA mutase cobalamin-binding subunit